MDIVFNNLEELYQRLTPALKTKQSEMSRNGYSYVRMDDIWNYLKEIKWKNANDLSLYEMVSDVLNVEDSVIDYYLKEKLKTVERTKYFEEG